MSNKNFEKKCIAIHLPINIFDKINDFKAKTGKSQGGLIIDFIEKGLEISNHEKEENKMLFFVKVRIDKAKIMELGQKLQNGELNTSLIIMTFCDKNDPTVGMSFWKAKDSKNFEDVFSQFRIYYKEIMEITPVITPMESMQLILDNM